MEKEALAKIAGPFQAMGYPVSISLSVNHAADSFEFGPAGARHKVYYSDQDDLQRKIKVALEAEAYYKSFLPEVKA